MSALEVLAGRRRWAIEQGDVVDRLLALPAESVDCVVTSPPYWGLRDYGTATWEGGDLGCGHVKTGRVQNLDKLGERLGTGGGHKASNNAVEPFISSCGKCGATRVDRQIGLEPTPDAYVDRMVAVFAEVRRVLRSDGTCWVNLGDSYTSGGRAYYEPDAKLGARGVAVRPATPCDLKPKDLCGIPWRVAFALQAAGWWLRSDIVWAKPNPMPESVTDRPTRAHEYLFLLTKSARYSYDADAIREPHSEASLARVGGDINGSRPDAERRVGVTTPNDERRWRAEKITLSPGGRNRRTVWTIATEPYPDAHFATMPTALVEPCIKAGCPPGGIVLDPFVGSGTVVLEALRHGRRGIGFDLSPEYVAMARQRVEGDCPMFNTEAAG